jgi:ankyrin repeat protein
MSANASPIIHRRTGTLGRMMNMIRKPLSHEPNRKLRLLQAIDENNVGEALRLIKETGMTPNDINSIIKRTTPLNTAILKDNIDIVHALIEAGADVNKRDGNDASPIGNATSKGNVDIVKVLIEAGANVNTANPYYKNTPLILASHLGYIDIVRVLLEAGADVNMINRYNMSAIDFAKGSRNFDILDLLIEAGGQNVENTMRGGKTKKYRRSKKRTRKHSVRV